MSSDESQNNLIKKIKNTTANHPNFWLILIAIGISVVLSFLSPYFLTLTNFQNLSKQISLTALLAGGMTLVIISGGIDLSVGSIVAFSGVSLAIMVRGGIPEILAILIGLGAGVLIGVINGLIISKGKLPPFIATLGMMGIARGLALVVTQARSFPIMTPIITAIGSKTILGFPLSILMVIITYLALSYVLNYMKLGRYIYFIGDNSEAAKLSGINVDKYTIYIYAISGLTAGLGSLVICGRLLSAPPTVAGGSELTAIAAVIIGGTSFTGGVGTVSGTLLGAVIMGILNNGLNLLNVSSFWQRVFIGAIIILAVWFDRLRKQEG